MGSFSSSVASTTPAYSPSSPIPENATSSAATTGADPANTYGTGAVGLTALGGAMKMFSSYESGEANAKIDRYNAQLDQIQAQQAIEKGNEEANIQAEKGALITGAQRGAQAGGGIVAGGGTGGAVIASSQATAATNEMMMRLNAQRAALGYQERSSIDETEADFAKRKGISEAEASGISTAATLNLYADPNYRQRMGGGYGGGISA